MRAIGLGVADRLFEADFDAIFDTDAVFDADKDTLFEIAVGEIFDDAVTGLLTVGVGVAPACTEMKAVAVCKVVDMEVNDTVDTEIDLMTMCLICKSWLTCQRNNLSSKRVGNMQSSHEGKKF
jgi:hypothetical protein